MLLVILYNSLEQLAAYPDEEHEEFLIIGFKRAHMLHCIKSIRCG